MRFFVHAPTDGVPPLGTVMTPRMTRTYAGWSSRGPIHGQPGTQSVPAPKPAVLHSPISLVNVGQFYSDCAPDVIYPALYWEASPPQQKEHAPVSRLSDNQMPIPANRAPNIIKASPYRSRKGGQLQVEQPLVIQRWRGMYAR